MKVSTRGWVSASLFAVSIGSTALVAQAQSGNPYAKWGAQRASSTKTRAHVPPRGGSERKAIADAMRRDVGKFSGRYVVFVFDHLKVNGNWAYAITSPESPDGKTKLEPIAALLRRTNGTWNVAGRLVAEEVPEAVALRRLRNKFPSAPSDIFRK